jgi:hypothetical protein
MVLTLVVAAGPDQQDGCSVGSRDDVPRKLYESGSIKTMDKESRVEAIDAGVA